MRSAAPAFAQIWLQASRTRCASGLLLDFGWRFALGNANDPDKDFGFGKLRREGTFAKAGHVDGPAAPRFDDSAWRKVDLPHDWAVDLPFVNDPILVEHGGKPLGREYPETSVGWYRREFVLPASDPGRRICVEFDGIFRNATVFFNGHFMAKNMSGYAPLNLDLTPTLPTSAMRLRLRPQAGGSAGLAAAGMQCAGGAGGCVAG